MATKKLIQGLSAQVPIVEDDGRPTAQFCDVLQKLAVTGALTKTSSGAIDVGSGSITLAQIQNIATQMIIARKTAGTGSPEVCTISDILDFLGTTRGSVIYRGAGGWTLLAPGSSGKVLQTNGPGADPTWVTPSGGGGGGASIHPIVTPLPTLATWLNQGTATYTTNTDGSATLMGGVPIGSGDNLQGIFQALTIPYSFTIGFVPCLPGVNWQQCGIALRESGSGKVIVFGTYKDSGSALWLCANYNSPTSKNANVLTPAAVFAGPVYLQISNDGTTRKASFGWEPHGQTQLAYSFAASTFLVENQIGLYVSNANGGANALKLPITLISWQ